MDDGAYWTWQYESSREYFAKFFDLEDRLRGATVVDIGCGLGGRTCYLAKKGVRRIVGTDINHAEIDRAIQLAEQSGDSDIRRLTRFEKVTENDGRNASGQFEIALLVDSLEHVRDPLAMLNLAHSLLKPGGLCYFSTSGWYHHHASHVVSIVPIPFATVLFSDKQILDAVRKIVDQPYYQPTIWDSDPPSKRWQDCRSLHDRPGEYLNKYTIAGFHRAMRTSQFSSWSLKVQGFSAKRHPLLAAFNFLTRVPIIREMYHSAIFGRLVKHASCGSLPDADTSHSLRVSA
jgi:SAM-dependent methyltransferase